MQVSIIIPSLNSPIIDHVLEHLQQQAHANYIGEILIVGKDEMSLIHPTEKVRLIDTGQSVSPSQARNIGITQAKYDVLLFLDSDCLPTPDWLSEHIKAHNAGYPVVGGGVQPAGDTYWSLSYNITLFHEFLSSLAPENRDYLPTLNLSIARTVVNSVGFLNEDLIRGQDIEWTSRMRKGGFQPYFWPQATVYHAHNRTTLQKVWRDCARSGFYMRQIRLHNEDVLQSPGWLKHRRFILGASPFIAAGVTSRIIKKNPEIMYHYWRILPAIYLTKIAWCWGASRSQEPQ